MSEKLRDDGLGGKKMDINDKKEVDKWMVVVVGTDWYSIIYVNAQK